MTRVLVVDDRAELRWMIGEAIGLLGADAQTVGGAEAALDALGDQSYDLVLSDIDMPGLSGWGLLERIVERFPGTRVIMMSGRPLDPEVLRSRGAVGGLPKPFRLEALEAFIHAVPESAVA